MDDFDLEIAPLKQDQTPELPDQPRTGLATPRRPSPFAARLDRRGRLVRGGSILGVLLLALAILVAVTPGARSAVVRLVAGPTPTATAPLRSGDEAFAIENQVPWGTLTIDGHPAQPIPPDQTTSDVGVPVLPTYSVPRGRHQIQYRAEAFSTLRCTLSVPAQPSDTCPLSTQTIDYLVSSGPYTRLLDLGDTPDRLPPSDATHLADLVQAALDGAAGDAHADLAVGDHYLDVSGQVTTATEALQADPIYTLDRSNAGPFNPSFTLGQRCAILCADTTAGAQWSANDWLLYAQVDLTWRYSNASGKVILADGPPGPQAAIQPANVQVGIQRENGTWQARLFPTGLTAGADAQSRDPLSCLAGNHYFDVLRFRHDQATIDPTDYTYLWPHMVSPAETGCVFGGGHTLAGSATLVDPVALVLYRCGALVAVNDAAHADFPHIPWASTHEHALALSTWPPPSSTPSGG